MNENQAKQLTWDLSIAARRLNGNVSYQISDDPRHKALLDAHSEALKRFGHEGFNA